MAKVLHKCPVCQGELMAAELACPSCGTRIQGSFSMCRFCRLDAEQLMFLEVFLRCRGVIRDVERLLGVSYPTVRAKLDSLLEALGLTPQAESQASARREILGDLEAGRITVDEAVKRLERM
ncbi:MAG: DUF2089 domain-containing protein [Armatimonadota bacterium]